MIDAQLLAAVYHRPLAKVAPAVEPMREALELAEIRDDKRLAYWLAQLGHESGHLKFTREIWGPTPAQRRYERNPAQPWPASLAESKRPTFAANRLAYGLGNAAAGDGKRYMGRGWIQTTGAANYRSTKDRMRAALGNNVPDFVAEPAALEQLRWAALSAAVFWRWKGLNQWADADDMVTLTKRINGGLNGLADRQTIFARAQGLLVLAA
jgi:putative chitinase